jgi:NitT/TauT family transport system substrate-binding protein
MTPRMLRGAIVTALTAILAAASASCSPTNEDSAASAAGAPSEVTLGYFPNFTHAPGIIGLEKGFFSESLGAETKLTTTAFNAGPAAIEALLSGAIDATFIGPNPAINGFAQSKGEALRIVSGAASGGVSFVVKPEINSAQDLKGKKVGTPQLGNTQDVAVRYWLKEQGLTTDIKGGGAVSIQPQENAQILQAFAQGALDGAWVPEPWATRLVKEAGGKVLLDEADLWPNGQFIITHLIVRTEFLERHPDTVKKLIEGENKALQLIASDPAAAQQATNDGIEKKTKKRIPDDVLATAWEKVTFTLDPLPETLRTSAEHAKAVGLLDEVNLDGIYELGPLNDVLKVNGQGEVTAG